MNHDSKNMFEHNVYRWKSQKCDDTFREKAEQVLVGLFQIVYVGKLLLVNNNNNNNTLGNIIWKKNKQSFIMTGLLQCQEDTSWRTPEKISYVRFL